VSIKNIVPSLSLAGKNEFVFVSILFSYLVDAESVLYTSFYATLQCGDGGVACRAV
jgi:hypothetical protein